MTELVITPKWKDKTARFKGTVAAGEHVAVTIEGTGSIVDRTNLRLRVFGWQGEVLAQFPMPDSADAWDGEGGGDGDGEEGDVVAYSTLSCTLNLNTVQLLKAVPPGATMQFLFVLDDAENYTLYFKDLCDITHWPERVGDDTPYDLDDWPRQIDEWTALVADFEDRLATAETDISQAKSRVDAAIDAIPQTVSTAVTQSNSGKADKVANATAGNLAALDANGNLTDSGKGVGYFATASGLTTEQAARNAGDDALSDSIRALATDVTSHLATKQNTLSQTQMNAVDSGVTAQKVAQYDGYAATIATKASKTEMNTAIADAVASILANAPAAYDTLEEIAAYIASDQTGAAAIATRVAALETGKQDKLTFDTAPAQGSNNPVTSGGVYTALSGKAPAADVSALQSEVTALQTTVSAIDTALLVPKTWVQLKDMRDGGTLKPGQQYRITDYVATTNGNMASRSANHRFDIVVTADAPNKLNEHARAILHDGDTYFAGCNLAAWDVWYCIDNDTTRFAWALAADATDAQTGTGGRGVVYRLVDEFQNDVPYDFKGIQFIAYGDTDNVYRYTFDSGDASGNTDYSLDIFNSVFSNKIAPYVDIDVYSLNEIVFKGMSCYDNSFGLGCSLNTFGAYCGSNHFGLGCYENKVGSECFYINFGDDCYYNEIGDSCYSVALGNGSYDNELGSTCYAVTFGQICRSNVLGNDCSSIVFGDNCGGNVLGNRCTYNTYGFSCYNVKFGGYVSGCIFEDDCNGIVFADPNTPDVLKNFCMYITVGKGLRSKYINPTGTTSSSTPYRYVEIKPGVSGMVITDPNVGQTFLTIYKPAGSQEISI